MSKEQVERSGRRRPSRRGRAGASDAPEVRSGPPTGPQARFGNLAVQRAVATGQALEPGGAFPARARGNQAVARAARPTMPAGVQHDAEERVASATADGGRPLPSDVAQQMGTLLGADLSGVRIHTGREAAEAARSVKALAFAQGSHLVFGEGQFDPSSAEGRELLLHELMHVVQHQRGELPTTQGGLAVSSPSDAAEREASEVAAELAQPLAAESELAGTVGDGIPLRSSGGVGVALHRQVDAKASNVTLAGGEANGGETAPGAPPSGAPAEATTPAPGEAAPASAPVQSALSTPSPHPSAQGPGPGVDIAQTGFQSGDTDAPLFSVQGTRRLIRDAGDATTAMGQQGRVANDASTLDLSDEERRTFLNQRGAEAEAELQDNANRREQLDAQRSKLNRLMQGWEAGPKEFGFRRSVDIPVGPGLLVNVGMQASLAVVARAQPFADAGLLQSGAAVSGKAGFQVVASAQASVGLSVGLGAGIPAASAGVRGNLTGELTGQAGAKLEAQVDLLKFDEELTGFKVEGQAGLWADLVVRGSIEPYVKLGGHDFGWPIDLAQYKLAKWNSHYKAFFDTTKQPMHGFDQPEPGSFEIQTPPFAEQGISEFLAWLNADDRAHERVQELEASGVLARMTPAFKARLFAALRDGWTGRAHEESLLDLLESESDVEGRWRLLRRAYAEREGEEAARAASRERLARWADGALDWGRWERFKDLMDHSGRRPGSRGRRRRRRS